MYDARVGRWLSEDPLGFAAGDANLYRYVGNCPTGASDPTGMQPAPPQPPAPPPNIAQKERELKDLFATWRLQNGIFSGTENQIDIALNERGGFGAAAWAAQLRSQDLTNWVKAANDVVAKVYDLDLAWKQAIGGNPFSPLRGLAVSDAELGLRDLVSIGSAATGHVRIVGDLISDCQELGVFGPIEDLESVEGNMKTARDNMAQQIVQQEKWVKEFRFPPPPG
jgi:hypothetical protein